MTAEVIIKGDRAGTSAGLRQPPWARKIMCRLIRSHSSSRVVLGWITFSFVVAPKAHGWKSPNRGYRRLQRGGWGPSLFVTSAVVGEGLYGPPALEEEAGTPRCLRLG